MKTKGFVISVAILALALAVVGLAVTIADNEDAYAGNMALVGSINRAAYKYENIADNITDILNNVLVVNYTVTDEYVRIEETLPNKKAADNYSDALTEYKEFVERYKDNFDININGNQSDLNQFVLVPLGIVYGHESVENQQGYLNQANFTPTEINFNSYTVDIYLQNQNYKDISGNVNSSPDGIDVYVNVYNCKTCDVNSFTYSDIDVNLTSWILVETSGEANKDVNVIISPVGKLSVVNFNAVPIDLNTTISYNDGNYFPSIVLPENFLVVKDNELEITKN